LVFAHSKDEQGNDEWALGGNVWALAILGRLPDPTQPPTFDDAGNELTSQGWLTGFHANMIVRDSFAETIPEELIVTPETPQVIWAGQHV
jgi:hypothetical protein